MGGVPRTNHYLASLFSLLTSLKSSASNRPVSLCLLRTVACYARRFSSNGRSAGSSLGCAPPWRIKKDGYFEVAQAFSLASERAAESVKLEQRKASHVTQVVRYARRSSCQVRPRERQGGRREGGARLRRYRDYREPGRRALTSLYCAVHPRQLRCRALNDREFGIRDSFATWQVQAEEGIASRISTSEIS